MKNMAKALVAMALIIATMLSGCNKLGPAPETDPIQFTTRCPNGQTSQTLIGVEVLEDVHSVEWELQGIDDTGEMEPLTRVHSGDPVQETVYPVVGLSKETLLKSLPKSDEKGSGQFFYNPFQSVGSDGMVRLWRANGPNGGLVGERVLASMINAYDVDNAGGILIGVTVMAVLFNYLTGINIPDVAFPWEDGDNGSTRNHFVIFLVEDATIRDYQIITRVSGLEEAVDEFGDVAGNPGGCPVIVVPDNDGDGDPNGTDCDDSDATVYVGALELCDGKDNNCNGQTDEGCPDTDTDDDGDPDSTDCADDNANIHHGATEVCDGVDNNCDGVTDEGFPNFDSDGLADCVDPDDDNDGIPDTDEEPGCRRNPDPECGQEEEDNIPPVLTLNGSTIVSIACGYPVEDPGYSVVDEADLDPIVTIDYGTLDLLHPMSGVYEVLYTAQDKSGNSTEKTRTVTVIDAEAPVISLIGPATLTVTQGEPVPAIGATALDACDGELVVIPDPLAVDTSVLGAHVITYGGATHPVMDVSGNVATPVTRTITVVPATIPDTDGDGYPDDADTCPLVANPGPAQTLDTDHDGTVDACDETRYGTIAPMVSLLGTNPQTIDRWTVWSDPGSVVTDDLDVGLIATVTDQPNTAVVNTYYVKYTVTDRAGLTTTVLRTVNVVNPVVAQPFDFTLDSQELLVEGVLQMVLGDSNTLYIHSGANQGTYPKYYTILSNGASGLQIKVYADGRVEEVNRVLPYVGVNSSLDSSGRVVVTIAAVALTNADIVQVFGRDNNMPNDGSLNIERFIQYRVGDGQS